MNNSVLLAYSGGLDTTFCAVYLQKELKYNVHAVTIDTGGLSSSDKQLLEEKAKILGFADYSIIDAKSDYYQKIIRFLIAGNILKNNTYPLSVSAERIIQALTISDHAKKIGVKAIAHGSTGAGNDQVRFDMAFRILAPEMKVITPIRDLRLSRQQEVEYLKQHQVEFPFHKAEYSVNKGLWGTSVGGKETLSSLGILPEQAWPTPVSASGEMNIKLNFTQGELVGIDDVELKDPVQAIERLQAIAAPFGIGRDIHVGDTIIGIKGRVGFEAAAPILVIKAHHAIEKHVLTKWQLFWKDQLAAWYGNWLHEGQFLDPVMRDLEALFQSTQSRVTGSVYIQLMPHRFLITGIESPHDLMNAKYGAYGEMNETHTGDDVKGFTRIFGNQTAIFYQVNGIENINNEPHYV